MAKTISNLNKSQKEIINNEMDKRNVVSSSELIEDVDFNLSENIIDRIEALEQGVAGSEELLTNDKTIVGAINEVFQSANNGKELIANAIGEPLSSEDTFSAMSNDINSLLATFKTNMMNNGITVESSDRFKQLIDKIATMVEEGSGKGIQMTSGEINSLSNNTYTTFDGLYSGYVYGSGWNRCNYIELSLNFTPTIILVQSTITTSGSSSFTIYSTTTYDNFSKNGIVSKAEFTCSATANNDGSLLHFSPKIEKGKYILPVRAYNTNYPIGTIQCTWLAIGVGEEDTTLRDSLASILQEEGVNVTENDSMASLISKVADELNRQVVPQGNAVANDVLSGKTFINSTGNIITGTMTNQGSKTFTPSASKQTGAAGYYKSITVNTDSNLVAANIVSGKTIFGVTGTASASAYPVWYNPENTWMSIVTAKLNAFVDNSQSTSVLGDDIYIFSTGSYCKYNAKTNVCSSSIKYTNTPSNSELSRGDFTVVNCNGLIYFIGGLQSYSSDRQNANKYLMAFNPSNGTWTTKADMITALNQALACVYNNKIYVFGGCTYKEFYSGNYLYGRSAKSSKYDPLTNTWTSITDVPNYKTVAPVVANNCAYLPGTGGVTTRFKYDFSTDTYTNITSGLALAGSYVEYKNRIYSFKTDGAKMYDTTTGTETDKTICPTDKSGGAAYVMSDIIYWLGGYTKNSNGYYNSTYYYGEIYIPEK